jgi:hypothetical protein
LTPAIRAKSLSLSLPLLVARVRANDQDFSVPLDHAAAVTHRFDGSSDFHRDYRRPG